jgi:hypothetical protein
MNDTTTQRTAAPPWPPGRAEMAVWNPADTDDDAGRAFEQLEQHAMGSLRRTGALAGALAMVAGALHWLG